MTDLLLVCDRKIYKETLKHICELLERVLCSRLCSEETLGVVEIFSEVGP